MAHFLGLLIKFNSVGNFDDPFTRPKYLAKVLSKADHIRHAVFIDERRAKFKPALLAQDLDKSSDRDIKEVLIAGDHGNVGGEWAALERPCASF